MGNILKIHREIRTDQVRDAIIRSLLNSLIAVFLGLIALTFVPNNPYYPQIYSGTIIVLFVATWIISYMLTVRKITKDIVGKKIPEFDQIYITALEYDITPTEPAAALRDSFEKIASRSSTIPLLDTRAYNIKLFIAFVLLIILAFLPLVDTRAINPDDFMDFINKFVPQKEEFTRESIKLKDANDIYGEESVFVSGESAIPIKIDLSSGGGDYQNPSAWQNDLSSNSRSFYGVSANLDSPAIEELPAEFDVAKAYNLKIRQMR
jgi:hypothetical protein